jgi:hypothetical protein
MTHGRDVSVVVQGPVMGPANKAAAPLTRLVLDSVRRAWPGCELILSTWKGAATDGLDYDELVLNEDPGAVPLNDTTHRHLYNNLNRQIVSTRNGLAVATRPFTIKLRSDTQVLQPLDFSILERGAPPPEWRLLEKPIITLHLVTRHPLRRPVLFHLSDLFHAGLREDVVRLWSLPLVEEPAFSRAIDPSRRPAVTPFPETDYLMRCAPEQYLAEQLTRTKFPHLHLRHPGDGSTDDLFLWLRVLAANFRVLTPDEAGVGLPGHIGRYADWWDLFQPTHRRWLEKWARPNVPAATRALTALRFRLLRVAFRAPPYRRARWQRVLGRLVRATT